LAPALRHAYCARHDVAWQNEPNRLQQEDRENSGALVVVIPGCDQPERVTQQKQGHELHGTAAASIRTRHLESIRTKILRQTWTIANPNT
jgi:hypothetical protein